MKKFLRLSLSSLLLLTALTAFAQAPTKQQTKAAQKQAKAYAKEGWKTTPGSRTLEQQLLTSNQLQEEVDAEGMPRWIVAEGKSLGTVYDAARTTALQNAQSEMVRILETEVAAIATNSIATAQSSAANTESVNKIVQTAKSRIGKRLPRVRVLTESYRNLPNGKVESLIRIGLTWEAARNAASTLVQQVIKEEENP